MSKVLEASCVAGVVKVGALPVAGTTILSEGVAPSDGVLILDDGNKTYIPKTSPDLKTALTQMISAIDKISSILTSIGTGMTGPTTAPPGTLAADIVTLTGYKTALETLKGALK